MKKTITIILGVALLAMLAIYQNLNQEAAIASDNGEAQPKKGYMAPAFELTALDEKIYSVSGAADKLLMINFWASWCAPCEMEAPDLKELYEKYAGQFELYAVNATSYDKERQARQFVEDYELAFPILMDREGKVVAQYKVSEFPTTLLVDSNGIIRERITGIIPKQEWERLIAKWSKI